MSQITGKKIKAKRVQGVIIPNVYTLGTLPDAADYAGGIVVCSNGGGSGVPSLAYSNGTVWKAITIGATLASS